MPTKKPGTVRTAAQMCDDFTPGLPKQQRRTNIDYFVQIARLTSHYVYPNAGRAFSIDEQNNFVEL